MRCWRYSPLSRCIMRLDEDTTIICLACGSELWIAREDGDLYLMRIGQVEVTDCLQCSRATEAVQDGE